MDKKYYRTNQYIRASQLRVIGSDDKQIGILKTVEAQKLAQEEGLDLIEIAPTANPPVAKITDFKKFLYQEEKKVRDSKKKAKGGETKEVRLTPFIAKGDLEFRLRRVEEFLTEGNKVKVSVRFVGRQLGKREFGYKVLNEAKEALAGKAIPEGEPKWIGRDLILNFSLQKGVKDESQNQDQNQKQESDNPQIQTD